MFSRCLKNSGLLQTLYQNKFPCENSNSWTRTCLCIWTLLWPLTSPPPFHPSLCPPSDRQVLSRLHTLHLHGNTETTYTHPGGWWWIRAIYQYWGGCNSQRNNVDLWTQTHNSLSHTHTTHSRVHTKKYTQIHTADTHSFTTSSSKHTETQTALKEILKI